jgi:hypothetical protein
MNMLGDNLSNHQNVEFITAMSEADLKDQLLQIRLPYKILGMYAVGQKHVAWLSLTQPIVKKTKPKK